MELKEVWEKKEKKLKWIEEVIDEEDEKLESNIPDDLKILIWKEQENLSQKLFLRKEKKTRNKVNFKWHVNVMRSHVKWCFSSTRQKRNEREKKVQEMKENGKILRWLSINVNFMRIYYVSIYVSGISTVGISKFPHANDLKKGNIEQQS